MWPRESSRIEELVRAASRLDQQIQAWHKRSASSGLSDFINEVFLHFKPGVPNELVYMHAIKTLLRLDDPDIQFRNKYKVVQRIKHVINFTKRLISGTRKYVQESWKPWYDQKALHIRFLSALLNVSISAVVYAVVPTPPPKIQKHSWPSLNIFKRGKMKWAVRALHADEQDENHHEEYGHIRNIEGPIPLVQVNVTVHRGFGDCLSTVRRAAF
ncbi:hypothetical protein EGW08_022391 [Elysia chlorotica]|uniref:Uncharacterized protein n=1 Tax=Elysia chlorotica TaxID=188477 RepID=A0A433SL34_ELYCH|nr:hypothetical protein EGW08_022391 [Elysia chlorotica]